MKGLFHLYLLFVPRCTSAILHIFSGDEVSVTFRLVFQSLAGQKHCHYEQGAGEGLLAERYCCTCPDTKKRCREQSRC